jgi:hypothetical protein
LLGENSAVHHIDATVGPGELPAGVTFIEIVSPAAKLTECVRSEPVVAVPEMVHSTGVTVPFLHSLSGKHDKIFATGF